MKFDAVTKKKRKIYHPVQHKARDNRRLSKRTVFYMKEYGPRSHVATVIVRESIRILLLTSIISSIGGVALRSIESSLLLPLLMVVPAINHMVGSFGTIVASKFTTALYMGHIRGKWWRIHFLHRVFMIVFVTGMVSAVYVASLATVMAILGGILIDFEFAKKMAAIVMLTTMLLIGMIFNIAVVGGLWIYKKGEDPDNFLIPITTSLADFGSMVVFTWLVTIYF